MIKKSAVMIGLSVFIVLLSACTGISNHSGSSNIKGGEGSVDENGRVSISVSLWGNTVRNEGVLNMAESYEEAAQDTEISVNCLEWNDYWTGLTVSAAGHVLPDVIQMDYFYVNQFTDNNLLTDLTPFVKQGILNLSGDEQQLLITDKNGEGLYGIARGVASPALFYNQTLLKKLGITVPDILSMEDFIAISRQVYAASGYKTNIGYGIEGFLEYFCRGHGEVLYKEDSIGASRRTLEQYYSLYEQGISEGWLISPGVFSNMIVGAVEQDPMVNGKEPDSSSWCDFGYSNQFQAIEEAAPLDMEIGIASWPSDDIAKAAYLRAGPFFSVSQDSSSPEDAVRFLEYVLNKSDYLGTMQGAHGIPMSFLMEENPAESEDSCNSKVIRYLRDVVMQKASPINPAPPAWAGEAYNLNGSLVEMVCYGELSAKEAACQMLEKGKEIPKQ